MARWRVDVGQTQSEDVHRKTPEYFATSVAATHHNLDEDYETIYTNGFRPDPEDQWKDIPVGLCDRMCPSIEIQEREQQRRLNKYEILADSNPPEADLKLVVKEFTRSCVGREVQRADLLRPWSILKKTLYHLLENIATKESDDWMFICDFVADRLASVRQDMVIQRIQGNRYIEILEGSVRFLVLSMYKLTNTLKDKDADQIDTRIIKPTGPVKGLNNYEMHVLREMKLTMKSLRDCLNSLLNQYDSYAPDSSNRHIFESINLIINNTFLRGHALFRTTYLASAQKQNCSPIFKLVFRMYRDHHSGCHLTAIKHIPELAKEPILILAYAPVLVYLQIHLTLLLRKMYSSSKSTVDKLATMLTPSWLEENESKRIDFAKFIAIQNGIYDCKTNLCVYNLTKLTIEETQISRASDSDSDTRFYALQMIAGRDWSFFRDIIKTNGLKRILAPSRLDSKDEGDIQKK